ncbi:Acetyltransferase (GNAT) family [Rubrobacter radiotolerans]|uniref:Acetyltransferase (GNAT) family n=1 Tax=Rubrobacter radiotolerans TaxID=42256 RepID=A0A023X5W0_RUBRA|nr:GNAT family N-acetyltransferase [Rubrobacter radiotolerans]AHY47867.1 Acetyltransferase (GNAT) family [Rubrobacter radiotolerans]MDX5892505.1 GNAT family N-acetyltransferase [Rubrobacter radiotolerans]
MEITIRHTEPEDYAALHRIMTGPGVAKGTLQLPFQPVESWRRKLAAPPEGLYSLVACSEVEVIGSASLETHPNRPRLRHAGCVGLAVRDDWQGRGVGSRLLEALLDLAKNWLGLSRVELTVCADNEAAVALYGKFGFEVEGTPRRHALGESKYVDGLVMARLLD